MAATTFRNTGERVERPDFLDCQRWKHLVPARVIGMVVVSDSLPKIEIAVFLRALHDVVSFFGRPCRNVSATPAEDDCISCEPVVEYLVPAAEPPPF